MNLEIIMGLGALILIAVPIFLFQKKQRNKQSKTKLHLDNLGKEQGLVFSLYEFWDSNYVIGLDTSKKVLCYYTCVTDKENYTLISLAEVEKCTVINDHRDVNNNRVIDQIRLSFTFKDSRANKSLLFYDREANLNFTNELILAKKWESIISSNIGSKQLVEMR
ncbi:MAG: hypothetical protein LPK03_00185 [Pontibacter sp.]|nr:hypothetical protein [Pontibacter sp.]